MESNERVFNMNVGILGHVDSGKTSLARALSTVASTAAFDKNPQSQQRGITIDLGFSSFTLAVDEHTPSELHAAGYTRVQVTLVDCPGHGSLIRTIIGGAQIIDMCLLVIDATKGVQTQTAECLIIAEISAPRRMIVVVNKLDLVPDEKRAETRTKMEKGLTKMLSTTVFKDSPIVFVSACVGADVDAARAEHLDSLIDAIRRALYMPPRRADNRFAMQVDHCFAIKGQGTVMTGLISSVADGVLTVHAALCTYTRIAYFKATVDKKSRFHVTIGHETVMARCVCSRTHSHSMFRCRLMCRRDVANTSSTMSLGEPDEYEPIDSQSVDDAQTRDHARILFALLEFDTPVIVPALVADAPCIYIASRLDADVHTSSCRLAFHGRLLHPFTDTDYARTHLPRINLVKYKRRQGCVERVHDEYTLIVHSLVKKETDVAPFTGMKVCEGVNVILRTGCTLQVSLSTGDTGVIEGSFGKSGKLKVRVPAGVSDATSQQMLTNKERGEGASRVIVYLDFKKSVFDANKGMIQ